MQVRGILEALSDEMAAATQPIRCKVESVGRHAQRLEICLAGDPFKLNEHWEESLAWWGSGLTGSVAVVLPERSSVLLWEFPASQPKPGDLITFYPPNFLQQLKSFWEHPGRADLGNRVAAELEAETERVERAPLKNHFPKLRQAQTEAMGLIHQRIGFLWGPPGTGKTFTLGALAANILLNQPHVRILLVAATNRAVDEALLSIDERLKGCTGQPAGLAEQLRLHRIKRYGARFEAARFHSADKQHLVSSSGKPHIVSELARLEAERPEQTDAVAYLKWKERRDALRAQIPKPDLNIPLLAITATAALFVMNELEKRKYDYVIFDEASQLSMPHACAIGTLGRHLIFAGDHKQLAPIVQSKLSYTQHVLSCSPFKYKDNHPCYQLDEQSRMQEEISNVVADMSYDGQLRVAIDCRKNAVWKAEREIAKIKDIGKDRVFVKLCEADGKILTYGGMAGPFRPKSAEYAINLAEKIQQQQGTKNIAILTPFRVQRHLLRQLAQKHGLKDLHISTIHSAQGGEFHTVIFDPVLAGPYREGGVLLENETEAKRLVNVALSRAKARFVVILSQKDLSNPALLMLADAIDIEHGGEGRRVFDFEEALRHPRFPRSHEGQLLQLPGSYFKVAKHWKDDYFWLIRRGGHRSPYKIKTFNIATCQASR